MSLSSFLAGRPRPNAYVPGPAAPWALQRRHAEGGGWETVRELFDERLLRDEVLAPTFEVHEGDLVRLQNPQGLTHGFWVQTPDGLADAGLRPDRQGYDWVAFWEGPRAEAEKMLRACGPIDPRVVVRLAAGAAAMAENEAEDLDPAEPRYRAAVTAVARWLAGEDVGAEELSAAAGGAWAARDAEQTGSARSNAIAAAAAAAVAARAAADGEPGCGYRAADAAANGARVLSWSVGPERFARAVEAAVPLSQLLLARARDARGR